MGRVSPQERMDPFERFCRAHGLPLTVQRRMVFKAILGSGDHPTADKICTRVKRRVPGISRTTVYRILDTFVELGLINKICHHGAATRFDPKIQPHHHLVCMACERIIDLDEQRLTRVQVPDVRRYGFKISDYHIHFRGICSGCRARTKKGGAMAHRTRTFPGPPSSSRAKKRPAKKRRNEP